MQHRVEWPEAQFLDVSEFPCKRVSRVSADYQRIQIAPLRLKKSELYLPENARLFGNSPISSIICAMWSSSLLYREPDAGSNR